MFHPWLISGDAKARYQQMLQEAEEYRLAQRVKGHKPGLLQRSGDFLIMMGQKLKAQAQSRMVEGVITYDHHNI